MPRIIYVIINFLLLILIIYLIGRKMILNIFRGRREKINQALDEISEPIPSAEEFIPALPVIDNKAEIEAEIALREQKLADLKVKFEQERESLRRETLLKSRSNLVQLTMDKARQYMKSEDFLQSMRDQEDKVADRILSLIKLTPGDMMYLEKKGRLYVSLFSSYPLKLSTIGQIHQATDKLLEDVGGISSFRIVDNEEGLIGGFRLRIGDTVYDYTVKDRLYMLQEALNAMPLKETDFKTMLDKMRKAVGKINIDVDVFQLGRVLSVSDGICWLDGLADIMYGELVEFVDVNKKMYGMVMDVQQDRIGVMIFGKFQHIESYSRVRRLGRMAETPVGEEMLGRVVNPIGEPIDGKGRIWSHETRPIECAAPAIPDRQPVKVPLETGIKAIDALVPIGRGQRELIIGDRQTGKTSIAVDTIINQKGKDVICIYVAIGQKETTVATIVDRLQKEGAMDYTTVVCAAASDSASLQYVAPFAGTAMAEYFMYKGKDVLIVYDDLSKHAIAYRELSLLLHRPSGREAYPGDIFYLHSRLLERSANIIDEAGGGSITALPIIETLAGDISAYIPTNVISITDGQIFLESDLFNAGQRPAVNVGLSVSRVGGSAQTKLMKQVASNLRTGLAQYREYASFTQFGADIDETTRKTLATGERMMAALKQDRYSPMPTWEQALLIYAVSNGAADKWEPAKIEEFSTKLLNWFLTSRKGLCDELKTGKKMSKETKAELDAALAEFGKTA
ncbi:MAG: F0F1 ATP synthase subunit alpha [Anaerolineaceae bacterium]|nr:F0F1 ATP synthase subunit alpha [Anaerolineaceae bacterium]